LFLLTVVRVQRGVPADASRVRVSRCARTTSSCSIGGEDMVENRSDNGMLSMRPTGSFFRRRHRRLNLAFPIAERSRETRFSKQHRTAKLFLWEQQLESVAPRHHTVKSGRAEMIGRQTPAAFLAASAQLLNHFLDGADVSC